MPFVSDLWRPLTPQEVQDTVDALRTLVDSATPVPKDNTKNYHEEVGAVLSTTGEGYVIDEYSILRDQTLFEYFLNGESLKYYRVLQSAWDATKQQRLKYIDLASAEWQTAIPLLFHAMDYTTDAQAEDRARVGHADIVSASEAGKRLRSSHGYTVNIVSATLQLPADEYQQLYDLLVAETRARAGGLFMHVYQWIQQFWWPEFRRYVTRINTSPMKTAPSTPLGYIFQLAAKAVSEGNVGSVTPTLTREQYFELVTDICSLERVELYNWAQLVLASGNTLLRRAGNLAKLQFAFALPQLDDREVVPTLRAAFSWIDADIEGKLGWSLRDAIRFYEAHLGKHAENGALGIPKSAVRTEIAVFSAAKFEALWSTFVHAPKSVNVDFSRPFAASTADAYFKPMIAIDAETAIVPLTVLLILGLREFVWVAWRIRRGRRRRWKA